MSHQWLLLSKVPGVIPVTPCTFSCPSYEWSTLSVTSRPRDSYNKNLPYSGSARTSANLLRRIVLVNQGLRRRSILEWLHVPQALRRSDHDLLAGAWRSGARSPDALWFFPELNSASNESPFASSKIIFCQFFSNTVPWLHSIATPRKCTQNFIIVLMMLAALPCAIKNEIRMLTE